MRKNLLFLILAAGVLLPMACQDDEPVRIGFIGGLTSRAAGLGTSGRDGFLLAIEEANARGGIDNRRIEGLVQDTRNHSSTALTAVQKLAAAKVSAIVGPMTSQMAVTVVPEINRLGIPTVSPTVSTDQLSGLDDYFFRVYYSNAQAAELLAAKLLAQAGLKRIAVIYDIGNRAYTEDWVHHFEQVLTRGGGSLSTKIPYQLSSDTLFLDMARRAAESQPQGVLMLANAVDTAMICQQLTKIGVDLPRFATGWSYSDDLIQFGGKSVEGLQIIQSADLKAKTPAMQTFIKAYQDRYHTEPNFPALHAYDATRMLIAVLERTARPRAVRDELLHLKEFAGLQSDLTFDRYGDLKHPVLQLARIADGRFVITD